MTAWERRKSAMIVVSVISMTTASPGSSYVGEFFT